MDLTALIGEATEYDKKGALERNKPKSWLKSVSAFANGVGGALIFGITDDETLIGLDDARADSEKISELLAQRMDPIPQVNLSFFEEQGKTCIILRVFPGRETPYYYVGDGNHIAFVRVGNQTRPADTVELKKLVMHGSNFTFDSLGTAYPLDDHAFTKLRSVYRMRTGQELERSDFYSFGLVNENCMLTNAGALLADESPERLRHSRLFCTRWNGLTKASGMIDALDDREVSGSLLVLLQAGEDFVRSNTKKQWKKAAEARVEMPDYPARAVQECLVNALIHRDYMILGSEVHIDIYDDRMEISSPGGMVDGSHVQDLVLDHVASHRRNPVLADLFNRMHLMERRGSGFKKIIEDYQRAVNYRPELAPVFYSDASTFIVTLYDLNYNRLPADEKPAVSQEKQPVSDNKAGVSQEKQPALDEKADVSHKTDTLADEINIIQRYIEKQDVRKKTEDRIVLLYQQYGKEAIFSRADIKQIIDITDTPAGNLINHLKSLKLIEPVQGQGKGKYRFIDVKNLEHNR